MEYNLSNTGNFSMKYFAKEVRSTPHKVYDYLRERNVLFYDNMPCPGYEDWFELVDTMYGNVSLQITPYGETKISEMINNDGIKFVNARKTRGKNRKGLPNYQKMFNSQPPGIVYWT